MARVVFIIQREKIEPFRSVQPKVLFPIEAAFAGALLKTYGHEFKVFDLNFFKAGIDPAKTFLKLLADFKPGFIISVAQMLTFLINEQYTDTIKLFSAAKDFNDSITTIYAGSFATSYPRLALEETRADYIIRGEFELVLANLVNLLTSSGAGMAEASYPGLFCRKSRDYATVSVIDNLDALPFPAYLEFNYEGYFRYPGKGNLRYPEYSRKYTHYQTSRDCPCGCCFCNVSFLRGARGYRVRSLPLVLNDLETLVKKYGIEEIHFLDENIGLSKNRLLALCKGISQKKLKFKWIAAGGLSVYSLDKEVLESMWRAGCYRLNLAFESGSQEVLDTIIKKPVVLKRDSAILNIAKKIGFEIIGYFVIGLPSETNKQIKETIAFASNPLFDYVTFSIATVQEGTKLKEMCLERNLIPQGKVLSDLSRRAAALYSTEEFSIYELEKLRWEKWDAVNFSSLARKRRIAKMMGLTMAELQKLRAKTARDFKKRWPQDYIALGKRIGLTKLSLSDITVNMKWMKDAELRKLIERPEEKLTRRKQIAWLRALEKSRNKVVYKVILLDGPSTYIGNVSAFDISRNLKEAELGIFIAEAKYRGCGYGMEALKLLIDYLRREYGEDITIRVKLLKKNLAAYRTYEKIGFKDCRRQDYGFKCDDKVERKYMVLLPL